MSSWPPRAWRPPTGRTAGSTSRHPPAPGPCATASRRWPATRNHPYRTLAADADASVAAHLARTAAEGLGHTGSLDDALVPIPTAIGSLRPAAILPSAQAAAARAMGGRWPAARRVQPLSRLMGAVRRSQPRACRRGRAGHPRSGRSRSSCPAWSRATTSRRRCSPGCSRTRAGAGGRSWPSPMRSRRARGASVCRPSSASTRHADVHAAAERALGSRVFEITSLPPSVPGLRLFEALRRRILRAGARIQIGFDVVDVERTRRPGHRHPHRGRIADAAHRRQTHSSWPPGASGEPGSGRATTAR